MDEMNRTPPHGDPMRGDIGEPAVPPVTRPDEDRNRLIAEMAGVDEQTAAELGFAAEPPVTQPEDNIDG